MRRWISSTVTRLASVGCAVSTGAIRAASSRAATAAASRPAALARASAAENEPGTRAAPSSRSIARRRRMAAFCSAMLNSWNQMPSACSTRRRTSGVIAAWPVSTGRHSGLRAAMTSSSRPRSSRTVCAV